MTDIVERLKTTDPWESQQEAIRVMEEAADEIERLRAALEPFGRALKGNWSHQPDDLPIMAGFGSDLRLAFSLGDFRKAHAALAATPAPKEKG